MAKDVEVSYAWGTMGNVPMDAIEFYRSLPGMKERVLNVVTHGDLGRGGGYEATVLGGSIILSSSVLAAAIKGYLAFKKRKVILTIGDKKLEYEGPDLKLDQEVIEGMIDKLADEEGMSLRIQAKRVNPNQRDD